MDIEQKFVGFCQKVFGRVVKTIFQVSTRKIWWFFFPKKPCFKTNREQEVENCSLLSKVFRQNCQNCILSLHGITLQEICLFDQMGFRFIFEDWKEISPSSKSFSAGLLKLQSMFLKKIFDEILVLIKISHFFIFGNWAERFRPSGKICAGKLSELHSKFPKEFFC